LVLNRRYRQRTDAWTVFRDGSIRIDHTILVGAESHKPIVIGAKAQVLKQVRVCVRLVVSPVRAS
jgi:GTPase Era involved in 16S rRNA processing